MSPAKESVLRAIPSVESLLQDPALGALAADIPRRIVTDAVREAVEDLRSLLVQAPDAVDAAAMRPWIVDRATTRIRDAWGPHYCRAINATGIILHTALGRAVLPAKAIRQIADHLSGYSVLQTDVETGKRSSRDGRIEWMLRRLTGAEAATVVNNNAAATMIVLNTVARGKEVIVSRGQLVEIGGSFRLPDVMAASGATLVEVGTTNKTHLRDYAGAITENTAAILRVHPSNYRIYGFTSEVPGADLARLAHERGLVFIDDVGAGALFDYARFGFTDEPALPDSVRSGADLITSSADKLIGASQGGIILGTAALIQKVRKNPLARILRVGKLTLAALEATLSLFFDEDLALRELPTLRMLVRDLADTGRQAKRIASAVRRRVPDADVAVIDGSSQMGSGSLPTQNVPTRLVAVRSSAMTADALAASLRRHEPPVFARIQDDRVLLDPRTLLAGDEQEVVTALAGILARKE
ncbi:MAG: L-seryl-tRNA(Sec) selenium transferase [Planctomycetes bacterium]|nr:L-seryl-tRNA(Sec) selenium transferase [Planctomycetota bacterium]